MCTLNCVRHGWLSRGAQYARCTRLWFQPRPDRRYLSEHFRKPKPLAYATTFSSALITGVPRSGSGRGGQEYSARENCMIRQTVQRGQLVLSRQDRGDLPCRLERYCFRLSASSIAEFFRANSA